MSSDFPHVEGVRHSFVDVHGLKVHVAEAGEGEPLVLQHGWPQHWYAWRQMLPSLAERYRVICPDLRGHGWTEAPSSGYEKEQFATDLLGVLDALELDRVRLIGHDWGGFAGFLACLRAPERFSRFVALGILHPWPPSERPGFRRAAKAWYQVLLASPLVGRQVVQRGFVPKALTASREAGRWTDEELATFGERWQDPARARATVLLYRAFLTKELRPILAGAYADRRLVVPTRLLIGEDDAVFKGDSVTGWEDHADDMQVQWIPGAAHWLPNEAPDAVLERTGAFLAEKETDMNETGRDHEHAEPHEHEHGHGGATHSHAHTSHDHEHVEHEHEHSHGETTHSHPHVHEQGLEEDHSHEH